MAYATPEELANHMGHPGFDAAETARATLLLGDATAVIVEEVGQDLAESTDTVTLDGSGTDRLLLPRWPVSDVDSVTLTEPDQDPQVLVADEDYTWSEAGILTRVGGCWPCSDRSVVVIVTAGHSPIPRNAQRICRRLAAAAWPNPAGADVQAIGDTRIQWHTPGMELTTAERNELAAYGARS